MKEMQYGSLIAAGVLVLQSCVGCDGKAPTGSGPQVAKAPTTARQGENGSVAVAQPPVQPRPNPLTDQELAAKLVGAWRFTTTDGVSSTFSFDPSGSLSLYVTTTNPLVNVAAANGGEVLGVWGVRGGVLGVEYRGGTTAVAAAFRGQFARTPLVFLNDDTVRLSRVELDNMARTYYRIR